MVRSASLVPLNGAAQCRIHALRQLRRNRSTNLRPEAPAKPRSDFARRNSSVVPAALIRHLGVQALRANPQQRGHVKPCYRSSNPFGYRNRPHVQQRLFDGYGENAIGAENSMRGCSGTFLQFDHLPARKEGSMMTSGLMTPQGSDLSPSFWARGETRRVDPTVARRRQLAATESHVRVAALLSPISHNNRYEGRDRAIIPDCFSSGFVADLLGLRVDDLADARGDSYKSRAVADRS